MSRRLLHGSIEVCGLAGFRVWRGGWRYAHIRGLWSVGSRVLRVDEWLERDRQYFPAALPGTVDGAQAPWTCW